MYKVHMHGLLFCSCGLDVNVEKIPHTQTFLEKNLSQFAHLFKYQKKKRFLCTKWIDR